MKKNILHIITVLTLLLTGSLAFSTTVSAAACDPSPGNKGLVTSAFRITPWYEYLPGDNANGRCRVSFPKDASGKTDITKSGSLIAVAIIELLIRFSGLIAAGFVIYGAVQYIMSQGEPEGLANAKNTIANALIGFVIVMIATALVHFLGRTLGA